MKLLETTFNNFRCFKQYNIKYGSETTIFIGKNGTGKSSILSGIRRGLSFMFAKPHQFPSNLATSNNAKVKSFGKLEANFDTTSRTFNYPIKNDFKADFKGQTLEWSLVKNNMNGGLLTTRYNDALHTVLNYYNSNNTKLPLLAVFSDSFPHQISNFGSKAKKIINQDILPRDLGYYGWDERTNCIELWLKRFYKVFNYEKDLRDNIEEVQEQIFLHEKLINNKDEIDKHKVPEWEQKIEYLKENLSFLKRDNRNIDFSEEREYVSNKLLEFTKPLNKEYKFINQEFELYRVSVNRFEKSDYTLEFSFKDGRVIKFDTLPMGYKRVLSIVIDIAYRSFILNGNFESEGIVLLDEIELHLHPTLQQEILQRFKTTFPNIQFIITTHSPLVISNFKADNKNIITKLIHEGNDYSSEIVENIYGIDYNTGLTEIMDSSYRKSEIDSLIDTIVILKKFSNEEQANKIKTDLEKLVGDNKYIQKEIDRRISQNK